MKFVMKEAEKFQMKIQNMKDEGIQKLLALNAIFRNNIWQPIDLDVNMICYCYAMLEALLKMQETVSLDIEYYPKV